MPTPMRMQLPLSVEFRPAHADQRFTDLYLTNILRPGVKHPIEGAFLFDADDKHLTTAGATIALGWAEHDLAAGLYMTVDGADTAWLHGVRVSEKFRGYGFCTALVRDTQTFVLKNLGIRHFGLFVRCSDSGVPNEAAVRAYERCGFGRVGQPFQAKISGGAFDQHLGPANTTFLTLRMEASL